eukprot:929648_1
METLRNRIITEHVYLMEQLELKYMNYIQQLLIQKSKIVTKMQREFYKQLHTLNTIPIEASVYPFSIERHTSTRIESDKYHIEIPPIITPEPMQTDDLSSTKELDARTLGVISTETNCSVNNNSTTMESDETRLVKMETEDNQLINCKEITPPGATKQTLQTYQSLLPKRGQTSKRFKCTHCNKIFKYKMNLTRHIRTHTGERPFKCNYRGCNFAAAVRGGLRRHSRTHTGEKPFKCNHPGCEYAAARQATLSSHILRSHSGVYKLFQCNNCKKRFVTAEGKRKHLQHREQCKLQKHYKITSPTLLYKRQ